MADIRRFTAADGILLAIVVVVAGGARAGYLMSCAESGRNSGPLRVQDASPTLSDLERDPDMPGQPHPTEREALIYNLTKYHWFGSLAPFATAEEQTAHVSPGYPWTVAQLARFVSQENLDRTMRWLQCGLGAVTAGLYYLFARRAFQHRGVAAVAGFLCALNPFWIISTAAIDDGVVISFLIGLALWLGARVGEEGGAFGSLIYGLTLAGAALVRAALLPFALVAMSWVLLRSRRLERGWLCALLAFLGFANGLAPWTVRNFQVFGEPVPIVDSTHFHLWVGNNPKADGGPLTDEMRRTVTAEELSHLQRQPERYARLGRHAWEEVRANPAGTLRRRMEAGLDFLFGRRWFEEGTLAEAISPSEGGGELPEQYAGAVPVILQGTLLGMLFLALIGWRWTYGWRWESMPSSLAFLWIPIPYILSHAEALSGPRLPLDGVLLCYAAFALVCFIPGINKDLFAGGPGPDEKAS
jgi:4-amino-4-deoxy-L-arabinose transferase-like glycosyltransferase